MEKYLESEKTVYSSRGEKEKEFEFSLAEYMPGISRIVSTIAEVEKCSFNQSEGTVSADVKLCIIYISDFGDKIKNAIFHETISMSLDGEIPTDEGIVFLPSCFVSSASSRLISSRKMTTRCTVSFGVTGLSDYHENLFASGESDGIYTQTNTVLCLKKQTIPEAVFESTNEVAVGESELGVGEIIYCCAVPRDINAKAENGAVEFDFILSLHAIYEPSAEDESIDVKYAVLNADIKLHERIENSKITENTSPCLFIDVLSCSPSVSFDPYGENKIIGFSTRYSVNAFLYSEEECEIVTDAFGEKGVGSAVMSEVALHTLSSRLQGKSTVSQKINTDIGDMRKISDCHAKVCYVSVEQTEKGIVANMRCSLSIFAAGDDGLPIIKTAYTNLRIPIGEAAGSGNVPEVILSVENCSGRISEGELICDFDISLCGVVGEKKSITAVTSFTEETVNDGQKKSEIIIYYPSKDDSLWSVAKRYRVNPDALKRANGLEGGIITGKKVILIP